MEINNRMVKIELPGGLGKGIGSGGGFKLPGLPGGSRTLPISSKPPDIDIGAKPPGTKLIDDTNPPKTERTPDAPEDPVVKPTEKPGDNVIPEKSKDSTGFGTNLRNSAIFGGVLTGGTLLGGEISNLFQAGAAVGQTAVLAEAGKEVVDTLINAVGGGFDKLTENPINLAIVAAVIAFVVLR